MSRPFSSAMAGIREKDGECVNVAAPGSEVTGKARVGSGGLGRSHQNWAP